MPSIHSTAKIAASAEISSGVEIGPYCTVGEEVVLGPDCVLRGSCHLEGPAQIGSGNTFFQHCVIGTPSVDKKHHGQRSSLHIGRDNIFREFSNVQRATEEGGVTKIGDGNLVMPYAHVAHECRLGNGIVLSNAVQVGGHVSIADGAVIGGSAAITQYTSVGKLCFAAGNSLVSSDVPSYLFISGSPARYVGVNRVGMERNGMDSEQIRWIARAAKLLFNRGRPLADRLSELDDMATECSLIAHLVADVRASTKGIIR